MISIRDSILTIFQDVMETTGNDMSCELTDESILLQTGMDSLGFAILVTQLEQEHGYDPFVMMDTPVYPTTFKEFVDIYERFQSHRKQ